MTTYALDFSQIGGVTFFDTYGNPMAAGVRVRVYSPEAQQTDANILAVDWSRVGGVCPSINLPGGTYLAVFRGRQGPERPQLFTITPSEPPPSIGLSGSLTAKKIPGEISTATLTESGSLIATKHTAGEYIGTIQGTTMASGTGAGPTFDLASGVIVRVADTAQVFGNVSVLAGADVTIDGNQGLAAADTSQMLITGFGTTVSTSDIGQVSAFNASLVTVQGGATLSLAGGSLLASPGAGIAATILIDGATVSLADASFINIGGGDVSGAFTVQAGGSVTGHDTAGIFVARNTGSVLGTGSLTISSTGSLDMSDNCNIALAGTLTISSAVTIAQNAIINVYTGNILGYFTHSAGAGHTVNFTDATTVGIPVSWAWDFGDTGTSTSQNPSHTYASAGTKTVTLTVTDGSGNISDCSINVVVA